MIDIIERDCLRFVYESAGQPIYRFLPKSKYGDFSKIKIRKKRSVVNDKLNELFSTMFGIEIFKTTLFSSGNPTSLSRDQDDGLYYVFPADRYKYLYSMEIQSSSVDYRRLFESLFDSFDDVECEQIVKDLLKFTYESNDLEKAIRSGSEIIFYGSPFYYAIHVSLIKDYEAFISEIRSKTTCQ